MKRIVLFLCILSASTAYSQNRDFNFILSVDNDLRNVYVDEFEVTDMEGNRQSIRVNYTPGNLSMNEGDFQKLASENIVNMALKASYIKQCGDDTETFDYDIGDFKLAWLTKGNHFILYIYNMSTKNYRRIYHPLPNKNFTFEYDWSEGSMRRVQKKQTKDQKRCNN